MSLADLRLPLVVARPCRAGVLIAEPGGGLVRLCSPSHRTRLGAQSGRYLIAVEIPRRADVHTLSSWHAVADQVAAALRRAGLPVTGLPDDLINGGAGRGPGAFVQVDPIADSAGGVFVFWRMPDELALPAREALLARRLDDPVLQRHGRMMSVMIDAMKRLLSESGFAVEDAEAVNDLRALEIHVKVEQP